ncbi:MAG: carbohydrate-binding protein, partial [candidate division WOR-3 bacterium]
RTVKNISTSDSSLLMHNKGVINIIITAEYADRHTEIVTGDALYTSYDPEIIKVTAGMITALSVGKTLIKVSFKDSFGNVSGLSIPLEVINRNPYKRNEAEDFNEQLGVQAETCYDKDDGKNIGYIQNGDWIKFSSIDFGKGVYSFQARVASATNGGTIEIYTDSLTGKLVGSLIVKGTNGWQNWTTNSCNISGVSGIHDIYFKFTGSGGFLLNLNWWKFKTK